MKKIALVLLTLFSGTSSIFAQNNDYNEDFFLALHSSFYLDYIWTPLEVANAPTGNMKPDPDNPGNTIPIYAEIPFQSFTNNFVSFGLEPRFNIRTLDENSAIAISAPITIGLGQVTAPPYSDFSVGGIEGFGSIQIPIFAKLYVGSGSTYDCEKDVGISMGIGLEYNKVGLIRFDQSQSSYQGKTGFVLPVASIGFHFWRGYNPAEINIKYGQTAPTYFSYDRNGDSIRDATNGKVTQGRGMGRVIKITMSQILNY